MDVTVMIHLTVDEVNEKIPYMLVCETTSSARWNTSKVQRAFHAHFSDDERAELKKIRSLAHSWALTKGVPSDGVQMSVRTLQLWQRFGDFCAWL